MWVYLATGNPTGKKKIKQKKKMRLKFCHDLVSFQTWFEKGSVWHLEELEQISQEWVKISEMSGRMGRILQLSKSKSFPEILSGFLVTGEAEFLSVWWGTWLQELNQIKCKN